MSRLVFCESSPRWATKFRQMCGQSTVPRRATVGNIPAWLGLPAAATADTAAGRPSHGTGPSVARPTTQLPTLELRLLDELQQFASHGATELVAIEITPEKIDEAISWVSQIGKGGSHACCVALASRDFKPQESVLRMAGFIDVYTTVAELPRLARLTQRHLCLLPEEEISWWESVNRRLPWSRYASESHTTTQSKPNQ